MKSVIVFRWGKGGDMKRIIMGVLMVFAPCLMFAEIPAIRIADYNKSVVFNNQKIVLVQSGDKPEYKDLNYNDSNWTLLAVPTNYLTVFGKETNIFWTRIHFRFPAYLPDRDWGIKLGEIYDVDETFFNGVKIGGRGTFEAPMTHAYEWDRMYQIPTKLINTNGDNVIAIRSKGAFDNAGGMVSGQYEIAPYDQMLSQFYKTSIKDIFLIIAYIVISAYFMLFFVRRPKEPEYLIFGLFTLTLSIYSFLRTEFRYVLTDDFNLLKKIEYMVLYPTAMLYPAFIFNYFKKKQNFVLYIFYGIGIVGMLTILFTGDPQFWSFVNKTFMQYSWAIGIICAFIVLFQEVPKNRDARYMLFAFAFLMVATVNDTLVSRNILHTPLLLTYGFFLVIVSFALILANRFVRLNNEVEDLNKNLEKKVEQRTEEVRTLLEQQHGDYYLTSLLIQPLIINSVHCKNIEVDFYINQKKKFQFKKRDAQLGGDICVARMIPLQAKNYIAFTNGDAMGKSMQGAGGALVLGVVFNSLIERTLMEKTEQAKTPEQWLSDTYNQLETIYESFDGSMMISGVIGLLNADSGELYYFNAEHPWVVLYREGRASFLDDAQKVGRKIGTIGFSGVTIQKFKLNEGDALVMGSDGKDDLLIGTDENGQRIINEDETLFLRRVEEGQGSVKSIAETVQKFGDLTDDFTLLRIAFRSKGQTATEAVALTEENAASEEINPDDKKSEAEMLFQQENYDGAVKILESLRQRHPEQANSYRVYYILAHSYAKTKRYRESLSAFEKAQEFEPNNETVRHNIESIRSYFQRTQKPSQV